MRWLSAVALALLTLVAPQLAEWNSAPRNASAACRLAPCCVGKNATCPMHRPAVAEGRGSLQNCSAETIGAMAPRHLATIEAVGYWQSLPRMFIPLASPTLQPLIERATSPDTPPPKAG